MEILYESTEALTRKVRVEVPTIKDITEFSLKIILDDEAVVKVGYSFDAGRFSGNLGEKSRNSLFQSFVFCCTAILT